MTSDSRHRWTALVLLCMGSLMIVLDTTIVNVALPSIRSSLGFSQTSLAWVVNAYMLTFGGFLLLGGRLGDHFGHRRLFVAGILLFTAASLACGLSTSKGMLVAARAVQGVGGAVVSAVSLSLIVSLFVEPADRAKAMGVFGFVAAGGGTLGVLLGGVLTDVLDWHWIFLVNVPIGIAVCALAPRVLPASRGPRSGGRLDAAGAVIVTAGLILAVYAIVNGNQVGWTVGPDARAAGGLARAPRRVRSRRIARGLAADAARTLPPAEPRDRQRGRRSVGGRDVRVVLPLSAVSPAGARVHPAAGRAGVPAREPDHGRAVARPVGEARDELRDQAAARRRARARRPRTRAAGPLTGAWPLPDRHPPSMVLLGFGAGAAFNPLLLAAMGDVEPSEAGLASGIVNTSFMMGGALGLAVLASVAASRTNHLLAAGAPHLSALAGGYRVAFVIGAGFAVLAAALSAQRLQAGAIDATGETAGGAPSREPALSTGNL